MNLRVTSAAESEIAEALNYYEQQAPGLGAELLDEYEAALKRIFAHPEAWRRIGPNSRRCLLRRFPYGIVYGQREAKARSPRLWPYGEIRNDGVNARIDRCKQEMNRLTSRHPARRARESAVRRPRCVGVGLRYYNPDSGRWLNRDPLGHDGGLSEYAFVDSNAINYVDYLGLILYSSEGKTYLDVTRPFFWYVSVQFNESGVRAMPTAFYFQRIQQRRNCPGGVCNSNGTGTSSSFVTATIENDEECAVKVRCQCRIRYSGGTWTRSRSGGFSVHADILGRHWTRFHASRRQARGPMFGWSVSSGSGTFYRSDTFTLAPGETKQLYHGFISVAIPPNQIGAGFREHMNATCRCIKL